MTRTAIAGIDLAVGARQSPVETLALGVAGDIFILSTTVRTLAVTVHSTYVGHAGVETSTVHLALLPGGPRQASAAFPREELPVSHARDRCLLDHLAYVRDVLEEHTGEHVALDVPQAALKS